MNAVIADVENLSGRLTSRLEEIVMKGSGQRPIRADYEESIEYDPTYGPYCYDHGEFQAYHERMPCTLKFISESMCPYCAENHLAFRVSFPL